MAKSRGVSSIRLPRDWACMRERSLGTALDMRRQISPPRRKATFAICSGAPARTGMRAYVNSSHLIEGIIIVGVRSRSALVVSLFAAVGQVGR